METPKPKNSEHNGKEPQAGAVKAHPTSPSAPSGPGLAVAPTALGLDRQFTSHHLHPDSPAARLDWPIENDAGSADSPFGAPPGLGEDDGDADDDGRESAGRSRKAQAWQYIRDRLTVENVYKLEAVIEDPDLAMTLAQQELVKKIGRYANVGDKSGIRRGVLDLVEKLDVASPADGAVLVVRPDRTEPISPGLMQQLMSLESGKQPLEMTQGGKVLRQLAPVLAQNGTFGGKDGMDRAWGRLTERFTQQAQGQVDIVVAAQGAATPPQGPAVRGSGSQTGPGSLGTWQVAGSPSNPSSAPIGQWVQPDQAGNAQLAGGGDQGVGQWKVPGTPSDPSNAPVGQWIQPNQAGNAQLQTGGDQGVGQWKVPGTPSDPSNAPVGQWIQPNEAGNAQLRTGGDQGVGQWKVPGTPSDPSNAPVGQWIQPNEAGNAQLQTGGDRGVGQWKVPGTASDPSNAPVGQWIQPNDAGNAQLAAGGDQAVGKWEVPGGSQNSGSTDVGRWTTSQGTAGAPTGGQRGGIGSWAVPGAPGSPLNPQIGQWIQGKDLPIADGLNLSDVLRQNPNISGVRLVELIPGQNAQQPSRLGTLASAARSLLAQRFGLR